jgi:NTE family protein
MTKIHTLLSKMLITFLVFSAFSCSHQFMVINEPVHQPAARVLESPPQVALVLGGGAFHGMAHVGVIKVLEDAGVPIELIVGTSAGSMAGALYADYPHIDSLIPLVKNTTEKSVFDFSLFRSREGFISGKRLQSYLAKNMRVANIEEMEIPFVAVTTDIEAGKSVALAAGPIGPSVNASCAIPGIFEPVKMYGTTFVDGGVLDAVPADIAIQYHSELIIAVDVMANFNTCPPLKNYKKVFERSYSVAAHAVKEQKIMAADIIISPDLTGIPLMSSKDNEKMYQAGLDAAKAALPKILKMMKERGIKPLK